MRFEKKIYIRECTLKWSAGKREKTNEIVVHRTSYNVVGL
jgi:hypothetical protein